MAISKKRAPNLPDSDTNYVFSKIYDDMNEIINAVNQGDTSAEKKTELGKSGDIRVAKLSNGSYELQGKTNEGWASVAITIKEK